MVYLSSVDVFHEFQMYFFWSWNLIITLKHQLQTRLISVAVASPLTPSSAAVTSPLTHRAPAPPRWTHVPVAAFKWSGAIRGELQMKGAADSHHSELGRGLRRTTEVERSEGLLMICTLLLERCVRSGSPVVSLMLLIARGLRSYPRLMQTYIRAC